MDLLSQFEAGVVANRQVHREKLHELSRDFNAFHWQLLVQLVDMLGSQCIKEESMDYLRKFDMNEYLTRVNSWRELGRSDAAAKEVAETLKSRRSSPKKDATMGVDSTSTMLFQSTVDGAPIDGYSLAGNLANLRRTGAFEGYKSLSDMERDEAEIIAVSSQVIEYRKRITAEREPNGHILLRMSYLEELLKKAQKFMGEAVCLVRAHTQSTTTRMQPEQKQRQLND